jgi:glycosyltransferase involved in cell wall biosynthesis
MRIVVITDCIHYKIEELICNKNPILTKQLDSLLTHFDKVVLVAPIVPITGENGQFNYYSKSLINKTTFFSTPLAGGNRLWDKIKFAIVIPKWLKLFWKIRNFDIYYLRFPNNLNIISFLFYKLLNKKIVITYTGTWQNYLNEPFTYRLQKYFIKYLHSGPAFVYSSDKEIIGGNILSSFSPSFTKRDCQLQFLRIKEKIDKISMSKTEIIEFITVGAVVEYKNQLLAIKLIQYLNERKLNVRLRIVGSGGAYLNLLKEIVQRDSLEKLIIFEGYKSKAELDLIYHESHFLIHTPTIEGYGKTIQEGFFNGLIPILTNFPYAKFFVGDDNERGWIIDNESLTRNDFFYELFTIINNPLEWTAMVNNGFEFASTLTIDTWVEGYLREINPKVNEI